MFNQWFAENFDHKTNAAWLALLRVWIGAMWLTGGWGKLTFEGGWSAAGFLRGTLERETVPFEFWRGVTESILIPNVAVFDVLVPWGQFLIGLALILGVVTNFAAAMGIAMNLSFLMSGAISANPYFIAIQTVLILGAAGYTFGFDRYLAKRVSIPFILPRYELKVAPQREGA